MTLGELMPIAMPDVAFLLLRQMPPAEVVGKLVATGKLPEPVAQAVTDWTLRCLQGAIDVGLGQDCQAVASAIAQEYESSVEEILPLLALADEMMQKEAQSQQLLGQLPEACAKAGITMEFLEFAAGTSTEVFDWLDAGETPAAVSAKLAAELPVEELTPEFKAFHELFCRWQSVLYQVRTQLRAGGKLEETLTAQGIDTAPPLIQLLALRLFAGYA